MKRGKTMNQKRFLSVLLSLAILVTTCASVFSFAASAIVEMTEEVTLTQPLSTTAQVAIAMTVGSDENDRNFTWYFNSSTKGYLDIAERNGDTFPSVFKTYESSVAYNSVRACYYHRVSVYGLKPDTRYVYRLRNGNITSKNYYFETDPADAFNFVFAADAQIGASLGAKDDKGNWNKTVNLINQMFPETSLLVLGGDQIEYCNSETQMDDFLSPALLPSFVMARSVGNHESYYKYDENYAKNIAIHDQHFFDPNTLYNGSRLGATEAGSDYWYSYNNVLFMHINSNNRETAEHEAFVKAAVDANPNATWRVVVMHYALFGAHYFDNELIIEKREQFTPIFEKYDVDVVLNGHEHLYARTYMIEDKVNPKVVSSSVRSVTDPKGILYITAPSASGSKYYGFLDESVTPLNHLAYKAKEITAFLNIEVDNDSFKITTYNTADKSVVDYFEIVKTNTKTIPTGNNVALGKGYTTSKVNASYPNESGSMTDGKIAPHDAKYDNVAYAGFNKNDGEVATITVDLGKIYNLDRFVSRVASSFNQAAGIYTPKSMEIYVSNDNSTWTKAGSVDIVDRSDISCIPVSVTLNKAVSARYVQYRYNMNKTWVMVAEVQAFEAHEHDTSVSQTRCQSCGASLVDIEGPETLPNLALNKNYTGGDVAITKADGTVAKHNAKLTDGVATTALDYTGGWFGLWYNKNATIVSNNAPDGVGTIIIDLEKIYKGIEKVKLNLWLGDVGVGLAAPKSIKVSFSKDGKTYTAPQNIAIPSGTNVSAWATANINNETARYVKFVIETQVIWTFLNEIEVYGTETAEEPETSTPETSEPETSTPETSEPETSTPETSTPESSEPETSEPDERENIAINKDYEAQIHDKYTANLTDGIAKDRISYDNNWFAFYNNGPTNSTNAPDKVGTVIIDLDGSFDITGVKINSVQNIGSGVGMPSAIKVYLSDDGETWGNATELTIPAVEDTVKDVAFAIEDDVVGKASYVKFEFVLGEKSFLFIDEIEVYGTEAEGSETSEPETSIPETSEPETSTPESSDPETSDPETSDPDVSDPDVSDPETEVDFGDVDDDGDVDAADYVLVKRAVLNTYELSETQKAVADIDADSDVDATDYVLIKRIVLGTYKV